MNNILKSKIKLNSILLLSIFLITLSGIFFIKHVDVKKENADDFNKNIVTPSPL